MRIGLLLTVVVLLSGCANKDETYKKSIRPFYESLEKLQDDVKDGAISASFAADCDRAKELLDKAHRDFTAEDQARPSFVTMESVMEGYSTMRSVSGSMPDKIKPMAGMLAGDLEKAKESMDKGD